MCFEEVINWRQCGWKVRGHGDDYNTLDEKWWQHELNDSGGGEEGLHPGNISEVELIVFSNIFRHVVTVRTGFRKKNCENG